MKPPLATLLCVRIPDFALSVTLRGSDRTRAYLLTDRFDRGHVIGLSDAARADGARIGQTVTQAAAAVTHAQVLVYDAPRAQELWSDMLDALDAVTPLVEDAQPGLAFLDMHGIEGDFAHHAAQIQAILASFELPVRVGAASNRFCAYAATWIEALHVVAPGEEAAALAQLPLDVLAIDPRACIKLHVLGVQTLGELAALPHGPFVRRFGRESARWHEWARGIDRAVLQPRAHAISIQAAMFGEGCVEDEASVIFALRILAARIAEDLERGGRRAGALQLAIELDNGETREVDVVLAAPTAQERGMLDVLRAKLEDATFPAPIVGLRLQAMRLERGGEALPLVRNDDIDRENVAIVLARLEALLGRPIQRARTRAAHPLEERFAYEAFVVPPPARSEQNVDAQIVPQLRLQPPHVVDVRVRGGAPIAVDGRSVVCAAGPWRIEEGWFGTPVTRDDYDVVFDDDRVCRISREGTLWYMRGQYD